MAANSKADPRTEAWRPGFERTLISVLRQRFGGCWTVERIDPGDDAPDHDDGKRS